MVRESVRLSLSVLLILLSLPFLAISFFVAAICATAASFLPRFNRQLPEITRAKPRPVDQFAFESALTAYEDLIGAHVWKRQ